jgi:hypothetical protein
MRFSNWSLSSPVSDVVFFHARHVVGVGTHVQWGDIATWLGSAATSIALLLTYGLLRLTRREQRSVRADERRSQARKVSAWCEWVDPATAGGPDSVVVRLQNASDEPIYGTRLAVGSDWLSDPIEYVELDINYVLAPHYSESHTARLRVGRTADGNPEPSPPVEIIFSDASGGRFWHRDRYGGLTELAEKLPPSARALFFKRPASAGSG